MPDQCGGQDIQSSIDNRIAGLVATIAAMYREVIMRFNTLLAAATVACGLIGTPIAAFAADKPVVGLVMKSLANEFFKNMLEGAQAHNKEKGTYELKAVGMQSETDIEAQINAVENFITQNVNAIVIAPADSRALVPPLKRAVDAGVVVVNIDVELDAQAKKDAGLELAFVGPDNRAGAKMSGDELAKAIGKGGKVVIRKAIRAPTTRCSVSSALTMRSRRAGSKRLIPALRIGKPRKPIRYSPTC